MSNEGWVTSQLMNDGTMMNWSSEEMKWDSSLTTLGAVNPDDHSCMAKYKINAQFSVV